MVDLKIVAAMGRVGIMRWKFIHFNDIQYKFA